MKINTENLTPDLAGEVLRYTCFTKGGWGCYDNFNLEEGFSTMNPLSLIDEIQEICVGEDVDDIKNIRAYYHPENNITVFWYWDGDGVLGFMDGNRIIYNRDCKCDHDWQEIFVEI